MKALVYAAPHKVEVRDVALPEPRDGAVKVQMRLCGVCGSDIGIFAGKHPRARAPLVLGHEFVGLVRESRGGLGKFKTGDRVVAYPLLSCGVCLPCRTGTPHVCEKLRLIGIDQDGGMADHAWVDEDALFKVNPSLSDEVAALIEPLAVVVRSINQSRFKALDSTVVLGAGPIGIITAIMLKHIGASRIIITDVDEARLALCRAFGFDAVNVATESVINVVSGLTDGSGVDVVFECSGVESAALDMTKLARVGGVICMTGIHKAPHAVDLRDLNFKEQTIVGSRVYTKREFERAVSFAADIGADLARVVTHVVPLTGSEGIFDMIADPKVNTIKVLVDCAR